MSKKWVYRFTELDQVEEYVGGSWDDVRGLLGGKGANLAEMVRIGVPVPDGCAEFCPHPGRHATQAIIMTPMIARQYLEAFMLQTSLLVLFDRPVIGRVVLNRANENFQYTERAASSQS